MWSLCLVIKVSLLSIININAFFTLFSEFVFGKLKKIPEQRTLTFAGVTILVLLQ